MSRWFTENQSIGTRFLYLIKRVLIRKKSKYQNIEVLESKDNGRLLVIDDFLMLSERFEFVYHEMLVHVPLFSHQKPKEILIIGGGDGGCVRECIKHPSVFNVDLCEIDPEVINISKKYLPFTGSALSSHKLHIYQQDGYDFLAHQCQKKYDIILIDSTDPNGPAAALFTQRFYRAAAEHLHRNGIFCTIGTTPYYENILLLKIDRALKAAFRYCKHYLAFVPMYQSGCWSFIIASQQKIPSEAVNNEHMRFPSRSLKYYNAEIHKSSFVLPSFYQRLLSPNKR